MFSCHLLWADWCSGTLDADKRETFSGLKALPYKFNQTVLT